MDDNSNSFNVPEEMIEARQEEELPLRIQRKYDDMQQPTSSQLLKYLDQHQVQTKPNKYSYEFSSEDYLKLKELLVMHEQ